MNIIPKRIPGGAFTKCAYANCAGDPKGNGVFGAEVICGEGNGNFYSKGKGKERERASISNCAFVSSFAAFINYCRVFFVL